MAVLRWLLAGLAAGVIQGTVSSREEYYSDLLACPVSCSSTEDSAQWTQYTNLQRLTFCPHPVLFSVSLTGDPQKRTQQRGVMACTAVDSDNEEKEIVKAIALPPKDASTEGLTERDLECPESTRNTSSVELAAFGFRSSPASSAALSGMAEMREWLSRTSGRCNDRPSVLFSYVNGTILGFFAGARVDISTIDAFFKPMSDEIKKNGAPERLVIQHCAQSNNDFAISGGTTLGLVVDSDARFVGVQLAVRAWSKANCASLHGDVSSEPVDVDLRFFSTLAGAPPINSPKALAARAADCRWIRVEENEGCSELAQRCGIENHKYMEYNSKSGHCSSLKAGQPVCCSAGDTPKLSPSQKANGDCFDYQVKSGVDTCAGLAATYTLSTQDLFDFNNNKTWGWIGCDPLAVGKICLSEGNPPMPAVFDNAVCGPQVKDTSPPRAGQRLEDLNPCPLNVCCSRWGHCGTTEEFCKEGKAETGSPGTAGSDGSGCISNCGMKVVNNNQAPEKFYKLGYFEGYNFNRPCLNMDVRSVDGHKEQYTDVHFSFAHISSTYEVVIPDDSVNEWKKFLRIKGPRRILAFGGWAFSAERPNFHLFREATAPANMEKFAWNCVKFAVANDLDGIDFDWEYPGAPDIPGIPPGGKDEGANYLQFLKIVRMLLPDSKSLSIAAPASFWYLKQFPIDEMAEWLDYIVFMTYDLHGQWDAGSKWSSPGCDDGSCLRSHVNWTETYSALAMITKAGVLANKVLMGVSSYGRSFKMAQAGCWGPTCKFLGDRLAPQAKPGRCTDEAGYLGNAEIFEQINSGRVTQMWTDATTKANYLVYEGTEWVSYMDNFWRKNRELEAKKLNLGGTIEWAIDLQEFLPENGLATKSRDDLWTQPKECDWQSPHDTIVALNNDNSIPVHCLPQYTLQILVKIAQTSVDRYKQLELKYDEHFARYRRAAATSASDAIDEWVIEQSREYFTCTDSYLKPCCLWCNNNDCDGYIGCQEASSDRDDPGYSCALLAKYTTIKRNISCPQSVEPVSTGNITFTFRSDDKKKEFYAKIFEEFGVNQGNMTTGTRPYKHHLLYSPNINCGPGERNCVTCQYRDIPMSTYIFRDVPNPKDLLGPGYQNATDTVATIAAYDIMVRLGFIQDSAADIVEAFIMPALMLNESSTSMQAVVDLGQEIEKEEEKSLILAVVSLVLFVVPFIGKLASAASVVGLAIRTAAGLVGDLGLIGLDIYRITEAETEEDKAVLGVGIMLTGMGSFAGTFNNMKAASKLRKQAREVKRDIVTTPTSQSSKDMMKKYEGSCPVKYT